MTWIAIVIALASLGLSGYTVRRNKVVARALEAERRENAELKQTLVEVLDEEGNIRGQLALPGQVTSQAVSSRLTLAEKSVSTIKEEVKEATKMLREAAEKTKADLTEVQGALEAARSREDKLQRTLAEVVDGDGTVLAQLRLPGEKVAPPNRTPCGDMCKLAYWHKGTKDSWGHHRGATWRCKAGQGQACDDVREQFVDGNGQCVLFIRDDDVPAEDGTMPSKD